MPGKVFVQSVGVVTGAKVRRGMQCEARARTGTFYRKVEIAGRKSRYAGG